MVTMNEVDDSDVGENLNSLVVVRDEAKADMAS